MNATKYVYIYLDRRSKFVSIDLSTKMPINTPDMLTNALKTTLKRHLFLGGLYAPAQIGLAALPTLARIVSHIMLIFLAYYTGVYY